MTRKDVIGMVRAAALAAALFIAGGLIPVLGTFAALLSPLPILIYAAGRARADLRVTIAIVLAGALVAIAGGIQGTGSYLISVGLATGVAAWMLERRRPFEMIVIVGAGAMLAAAAITALAMFGTPGGIANAVQAQLTAGMARGQEMYRSMGMPNAIPSDTQAELIAVIMRITPALAAILAGFAMLVNLRLFWRFSGKSRLAYPLFGDLSKWSAPDWLIWGLIATGFGMLAPMRAISDIALNGFLVFAAIYFCQGLAIMGFYFQSLSVPVIVRGVIYFITIVQPVVAAVVCVAGVFDMWIDFRRLKPPRQEAGNYGDFL
ncbi:MAG TPA: DUF2232 domain-containing protein [Candidatus Binataceae bacterium]|nr:DUF2232 domain-containing protein [Candidatus Binataceae bacterium]